jgi:hypothetical protein
MKSEELFQLDHVLYTSKTTGRQEGGMQPMKPDEPWNKVSPHLVEILTGLRRQREELGSVADELIDLFREHGVTLPPDIEGEQTSRP